MDHEQREKIILHIEAKIKYLKATLDTRQICWPTVKSELELLVKYLERDLKLLKDELTKKKEKKKNES